MGGRRSVSHIFVWRREGMVGCCMMILDGRLIITSGLDWGMLVSLFAIEAQCPLTCIRARQVASTQAHLRSFGFLHGVVISAT